MKKQSFTNEATSYLQRWLSADDANNRDIDNDILNIQDTITFLLQNLYLFDESNDKQVKNLLYNLQTLKDELTKLIALNTLTPQNYGQKRSS